MIQGRILTLTALLLAFRLSAQIGGESTYRFLSLTNSARVAALGGSQVAINDSSDLNLPYHNPALLRNAMMNNLLFNYVNYMADIRFGYASYAFPVGNLGRMAAGVHYINYGDFIEADEEGNITGNHFNAGEYALNLIWAGQFRKWHYGINLKPVLSVFESYQSAGIAADAGIAWFSSNNLTSFGLVARNFGTQITTYYENGERESIPFDLPAFYFRQIIFYTFSHLNIGRWATTGI